MRNTRIRIFYTPIKWSFIICLIIMTIFLITSSNREETKVMLEDINLSQPMALLSPNENWRNFSKEQKNNLSVLGRYVFLQEPLPTISNKEKIYKILMWKYGKNLERRHFYHFTNQKHDPFEKCSVKNCEITYKDEELSNADAVLIHLQRLKGVEDLPVERNPRPENQRWVFLTDENPIFTFFHSKVKMEHFNGKFNWSMTYRLESDVPVPYGRTIFKTLSIKSIKDNVSSETSGDTFKKRSDVLVAVMGSNCGSKNHRWQYVSELKKYIKVDFYGKCGTLKCPGHFSKDCKNIADYKFYLSFENSNCAQYITEKLWWNAYAKNSIPIVMGASRKDYKQLLPPRSYIPVVDFARPADLARYILYVNKTNELYESYFEWKNYYQVLNEHGYFQTDSYHYCRLCEALNYNSKEKKIYNELEKFWSTKDCYSRWDE